MSNIHQWTLFPEEMIDLDNEVYFPLKGMYPKGKWKDIFLFYRSSVRGIL
jgi:hypothetical protein